MEDEKKRPRRDVASEVIDVKPDGTARVVVSVPVEVEPYVVVGLGQALGERRSPAQWAERLGHVLRGDPRLPQSVTHADQQHAAADQLHGWSTHAYNYQSEPFEISQADYESALEAGQKFPTVAPHTAALPASQRARFEGFVPCRSKEKR